MKRWKSAALFSIIAANIIHYSLGFFFIFIENHLFAVIGYTNGCHSISFL